MKSHRSKLTTCIPLRQLAHQLAEKSCQYQSRLEKAEQVYLNTLAIYAVQNYLHSLGLETNWEASQSQDVVMQSFLNIADLEVKGYGKLECRPVPPDANVVYIPEEAWPDRIAYVAVELNASLEEANILGFMEKVTCLEVSLGQLRSPVELPDYLHQLHPTVILSRWCEDVFDAGWQAVETFLDPQLQNLMLSYRETGQPVIKRAKLIDWHGQFNYPSVILLVAVLTEAEERAIIRVQLHPTSETPHLPPDLSLYLISETGERLQTVKSRGFDNFIQLPRFVCSSKEKFSVQIELNHTSMIEKFQL